MKLPGLRIIDRYLLGQFLTSFTLAVFTLSVVLVLANIFRQLLDKLVTHDVPVDFVLSFMAFVLPFSLTFTIPWGLLTASLLVFGRLSAENELVALRALGVSLSRLFVPVFVFSVLMALVCLWINVEVAPQARTKMKQTLFEIATSNPLSLFRDDLVISDFPGKVIYVQHREGEDLHNVQVFDMGAGGMPEQVIVAQKGQLEKDLENEQLLMHLGDAQFQQRDAKDPGEERLIRSGLHMQDVTINIPLTELFEQNQVRLGLSSMTIPQLRQELRERKALEARGLEEKERGAMPVLFEISKRYSTSVAGIALALLGVPLALTAHRKETSIGFALSVIIAFAYFLLMIFIETFKHDAAAYPHLLIWLPNVVFIGLGCWLFWRRTKN